MKGGEYARSSCSALCSKGAGKGENKRLKEGDYKHYRAGIVCGRYEGSSSA